MNIDPNFINDIEFAVTKLSQVPVCKLHDLDQKDRKEVKIFMEALTNQQAEVRLSPSLKNRITELQPVKQNIFTRILHWVQNIFFSRIGVNDLKIRLVPQEELNAILRLPHFPGQKTSVRKELLSRGYAPIIHKDIDLRSMAESGKIRRVDFENLVFDEQSIKDLKFVDCYFDGALFNKCKFQNVLLSDFDFKKVAFNKCTVDGKDNNLRRLHPYSRETTAADET